MMFIIHFSHYSRLDKWSLNLLFTVFRIFLKAFEKFKCKSTFFFFFGEIILFRKTLCLK